MGYGHRYACGTGAWGPIAFFNGSDIIIQNCTVDHSLTTAGIVTWTVNNVQILHNTVTNSGVRSMELDAIHPFSGSNILIHGNTVIMGATVTNSSYHCDGIQTSQATDLTISGNFINFTGTFNSDSHAMMIGSKVI
jgi:hypothetical protein